MRPPAERARERRTIRPGIASYLFLAPWAIGFLAFTAGPMLLSLALSFTDYAILHPETTRGVGLANYAEAAADATLRQSVAATLYYVLLAVPLDLIIGLILALALNVRLPGITLFRTVFFLPVMISGTGGASVAVALLWLWVFQPQFGLANSGLEMLNLPRQLWFQSEQQVVPTLVIVSLWGVGRSMLVYLVALQGVPRDLSSAAILDGASSFRRLRRVTLPLISPALLFNVLLDVIASLQTFTQALVITRGGPADSSLFYVLYLYRNAFSYFRMGYASALAWILFLFTLVVTAILLWTSRYWVFYRGGWGLRSGGGP